MKKIILSALLCSAVVFGSCALTEDYTKIKADNALFFTGQKEGVSCFRIPSIVTAPNGDLVAAIDERVPSCGDLKFSKDINIAVRISKDNGKTWEEAFTAVNFPFGKSASDPSMIVNKKTKEIFLFYNYMDLEAEPGIFYLHYVKSSDNGKTWSTPVDITSQIAKPEWREDFKFITSGRGCYTSDGKMIHTLVNLKNGLHVFGSDDDGATWYFIDTPITPADESKILELSDGSWMINSRVNGAGMRYSHLSTDKGKTWISQAEATLVDPSCNAGFVYYTMQKDGYDKDRLLFSNANCANKRENLTVRLSYDNGKTWAAEKVVYEGPSAYSSLTILENGDIAVFFEKDNYSSNNVVVFSLGWLTDGKDKFKKAKK